MSEKLILDARRKFLTSAGAALLGAMLHPDKVWAADQLLATLIDIDACDGCGACVSACRERSSKLIPKTDYPKPRYLRKHKLMRDWSEKERQEITSRLTPYNWLTIQKSEVKTGSSFKEVYIPRRCLHCLNPSCAVECPTAALTREAFGAVRVIRSLCTGDGDCTMHCPWHIPFLQPGTSQNPWGSLPDLASMFKCDFCYDLVLAGQKPLCVEACPKGAMQVGPYFTMLDKAKSLAKEYGQSEVFGEKDNGGTLTFYVSSYPLKELEIGLMRLKSLRPGLPTLRVPTTHEEISRLGKILSVAPIAGACLASLRLWRDRHL
ncbi:MAG: 4Fe-4S dicluster domain-containing protein [Desulfovibrionaceae bacterium]|nr:4Fe-4S dicluster domain-containing protein [Desulfovibrionaceae bacterium]